MFRSDWLEDMRVEKKDKDIFDRLMDRRMMRPLRGFYLAHKEVLLYLFFGGLTTLVSILTFGLFTGRLGLDPLWANVLSWIIAVLFAYVTNRTWVFAVKADTTAGIAREIASFFGGRLATLGMEEALLAVFITWLGFPAMPVKIVSQIAVVAANYFISTFFVFK